MAKKKHWYQSKTIWINGVTAIVSIAGLVAPIIPAVALPYLTAGVGIANIGLRAITSDKIGKPDAVQE